MCHITDLYSVFTLEGYIRWEWNSGWILVCPLSYLFERQRETKMDWSRSLLHLFTPHIDTMASAAVEGSKGAQHSLSSPMWVAGTRAREPPPTVSQGVCPWEARIRREVEPESQALQCGMMVSQGTSSFLTKYPHLQHFFSAQ